MSLDIETVPLFLIWNRNVADFQTISERHNVTQQNRLQSFASFVSTSTLSKRPDLNRVCHLHDGACRNSHQTV